MTNLSAGLPCASHASRYFASVTIGSSFTRVENGLPSESPKGGMYPSGPVGWSDSMRASDTASTHVVKLASLHCFPPMFADTWQRPHDELKRAQRSDVYTVVCPLLSSGAEVAVRSARGRRSSDARAAVHTRGGGGSGMGLTISGGTNEPPRGGGGVHAPLQDAKAATNAAASAIRRARFTTAIGRPRNKPPKTGIQTRVSIVTASDESIAVDRAQRDSPVRINSETNLSSTRRCRCWYNG